MRTALRAGLIFLILNVSFLSADQIALEAYVSSFDSIPLAVIPFSTGGGEIPLNLPWEVMADDFEFSNRFLLLRAEQRDTALFAAKNIMLCIDGEYALTGENIFMTCNIRNALTNELIYGKMYSGVLGDIRKMAHNFSNTAYELFFGERGPFESRILFIADKGPVKNVFIMDYDGRNTRQLTHTSTINLFPCFVDSTAFLWTSYLKGRPDIFTASLVAGSPKAFISSRFTDTSPAYSPIEDKVVFASSRNDNLDIYICDGNGKNLKQLTFNKAIDTSPCWSPAGYLIAFISDRTGQPQIYLMDVEGANVRRLTYEGGYQDSPAWSPKGDKIAYTSIRDGKLDIWMINTDGSNCVKVTDIPGRNEYPSWSPDGSYIVFQSTFKNKCDLFAIRPDGTGLRGLSFTGNAKMPDWSAF